MKKTSLAKNTLLLYIRIIVVTVVTLFSSRYIISALGESDYGVFNVIFGIVALFLIISGAMVVTGNRFLISDMIKRPGALKQTFSTLLATHVGLAIIFSIFIELVGLYMINNHLQIPLDRVNTAHIIFHLSVITFATSMIQIPYQSVIIANEEFDLQAYIEIIFALLLFVVAVVTPLLSYDSLLVYSFGYTTVHVIVAIGYIIVCRQKWSYVTFSLMCKYDDVKKIFSFASWNFLGSASLAIKMQGTNMMLNIFFGPIVNAARGIAFQVNSALNKLSGTMVTALGPRIIKYYDMNDYNKYNYLIIAGSKYTYQLMFTFSLPIYFASDYVLGLWLGTVPSYAASFTRLILIYGLIDAISLTLRTMAIASKRIKSYYTMISIVEVLSLVCTYYFLCVFTDPQVVFLIFIITIMVLYLLKILLLKRTANLHISKYFTQCILPCIISSFIHGVMVYYIIKDANFNFMIFVKLCLISIILGLLCTYIFVATKEEKIYLIENIKKIKNKIYVKN